MSRHCAKLIPLLLLLFSVSACNRAREIDDNGRTPLMRAAQAGDLPAVQKLARKNTINDQVQGHSSLRAFIAVLSWMQELPERRSGWTALMFAVDSGRIEVVRELLRRGADPNLGDRYYTPISLSIRYGVDRMLLQVLLDAGALPDSVRPAPLQEAARLRDTVWVRMLLKAHASVDRGDRETPLITAVRVGSLPVVQELLRAHASVDAKAKEQGWSALDFALAAERTDIVDALLQAGADPRPQLNRALLRAIEAGDLAETGRLLAAGANPNMTDERHRLALTIAIDNKREDIAFALLAAGAIVPGTTRDALLYASAFAGADSMIKVLLGDSLKPSSRHLAAAAAAGNLSTVQLLLEAGADARGKAGEPLRDAIRGKNPAVVRAILDAGADVEHAPHGETPLAYAVRIRAVDVTPVLLDAGAIASLPQPMPLIHTPIVYDDTVTAALLIDKGANVNATDPRGMTTLDHAIRLKKPPSTLRFLERHGGRSSVTVR